MVATAHTDVEAGVASPSLIASTSQPEASSQQPADGGHESRGAAPAADLTTPAPDSVDSLLKDVHDAEAVLDERVLKTQPSWAQRWLGLLTRYKLELQGIEPVPAELRLDRNWPKIVGLWFSASFNLLLLSTGAIVPDYAISHRAALIAIPLWVALFSIIPAYICTLGPLTGLRTMVFTRFSFGPYGTVIICLLNAATGIGYSILNGIQGGQTLSAVSPNQSLTPTVGIVIICIISLILSFMGIRILGPVEMWVWAPILVCFIVLAALAGSGPDGLHLVAEDPANPTTARGVLGIGALAAGLVVTYASISMDYSLSLRPDTNRVRFGFSLWLSFLLSIAAPLMLGASLAYSARDIPEWSTALETSIGTLINYIYSSKAGGFGDFLTVLLSLSVLSNMSPTFYSFGLTLQTGLPFRSLALVPRPAWPILGFALTLPLAIVGASAFTATLTNFLAIIGYWAAFYAAVVLVEHLLVRRGEVDSYEADAWDDTARLPWGVAAITASVCSLALIVPSMDQIYFTGPIAQRVGDLGFELGFVLTAILYLPLRLLERRISGR